MKEYQLGDKRQRKEGGELRRMREGETDTEFSGHREVEISVAMRSSCIHSEHLHLWMSPV